MLQLKRSRSPSPPPQHNYKFGPFKPPPQAIPQYAHQSMPNVSLPKFLMSNYVAVAEQPLGLQYFHPPPTQASQQQTSNSASPSQQQHSQHAMSFSSVPQSTLYYTAGAPPSRSPQQPSREEPQRHIAATPMFIQHGAPLPRSYVIQQAVEVCVLSRIILSVLVTDS